MLDLDGGKSIEIHFMEVGLDKVKTLLKEGFNSAVGHQSTADLLSELTGVKVPCERKEVKLHPSDRGVIITLSFRPEEGRVYSLEELLEFLREKKIKFYYFYVGPLESLT